jgi:FSR family fosmidomycin resistance protein-like MFS transporter
MKNKYLLALSAGHAVTDMNPGALMAMLPFIIAATGLNYAQAAGLTFAVSLASTLTQPVFGFMADRLTKTWLLPIGVLVAGCSLPIIGFIPNHYWLMFAAAIVCGIGVAAYHPEGARMANRLAGKKKAGSMSIFTVGGTIGIALGPIMVTSVMHYMGLRGSVVLAVPAVIMCVMLFFITPRMRGRAEAMEKEEETPKGERKNEWLKFFWLSIAISSRSIISHSLNTFLPLYWVDVLHQSKAAGSMLISFITFIGAIVTLIGGHLADLLGINKIIKTGWILLLPSVFFLTFVTKPLPALLILVPVAVGTYLLHSPFIVLGQKYLPKNMGFASGITLGIGVSIGGMVTPLLGSYADIHGLASTLRLLSILPLLGIIVAFTAKPPAQP